MATIIDPTNNVNSIEDLIVDNSTDPINDSLAVREIAQTRGNPQSPSVIANNPPAIDGVRNRQLMRWRVPKLGFVDMYINPQGLSIQERKVISKKRTRGGYIIQYWGEELATVSINGTTGSAGIEGINILEKVYRAEQEAFQLVAQSLSDRLQAFTVGGSVSGFVNAAGSSLGSAIGKGVTGFLGGSSTPPLSPTLASLAAAVELYYQGWVMKGYFTNFRTDESVSNGVGVFNYTMEFIVTDKRGTRGNFMPWHRTPAILDADTGDPIGYYNSDSANTPLKFGGEE